MQQAVFDRFEDMPAEEWDRTFALNIDAMFHLCQAAVPHLAAGRSIINTTSINADRPNPTLLAFATTKGAIQNFTVGLAQLLAERGIRVNCVAPGPVWTPLIPATPPAETVATFGQDSPTQRPAQPVELGLGPCDAGRAHVQPCLGGDGCRDGRATDDLICPRRTEYGNRSKTSG